MNKDLCHKMASLFQRKMLMERDDLYQEASLLWWRIDNRNLYNPQKASLNTFMGRCIYRRYARLERKNKSQNLVKEAISSLNDTGVNSSNITQEDELDWKDQIRLLSKEAKFALSLIFEAPYELLSIGSGAKAKQKIIQKLINEHKYNEKTAKKAVFEIVALLRK
jgi:DNA-directed RNA polymerase specialized sigma24 family protein